MSHYGMLAFTSEPNNLGNIMAPFDEGNEEYYRFIDTEEENRKSYEKEPEDIKKKYPTFEEYEDKYLANKIDPATGKYGYKTNPNAKWDYWSEEKYLVLKNGSKVSRARLKDINISRDEGLYHEALRFWELVVEGKPLVDGEERPFNMFKPEYYLERYGTKEKYAEEYSAFGLWGYVAPDGEWHEPGQVGWWGLDNSTRSSADNYDEEFQKFLATADPNLWVISMDCHI